MLKAGDTLLFRRMIYELMVSNWPTAEATKNAPRIAAGMNNADKVVFSRTLKVEWVNTRLSRSLDAFGNCATNIEDNGMDHDPIFIDQNPVAPPSSCFIFHYLFRDVFVDFVSILGRKFE